MITLQNMSLPDEELEALEEFWAEEYEKDYL